MPQREPSPHLPPGLAGRINPSDRFHHPFTRTDEQAVAWTQFTSQAREEWERQVDANETIRGWEEWFGALLIKQWGSGPEDL